jgi:Na+/H+-dicarboxylate symporter
MSGDPSQIQLSSFSIFIALIAIVMVAAPGVPGGAIMAALGILESVLGFSEAQLGLMITLYIAIDSFGTACNVTGDGAIAMIVNKIFSKNEPSKE